MEAWRSPSISSGKIVSFLLCFWLWLASFGSLKACRLGGLEAWKLGGPLLSILEKEFENPCPKPARHMCLLLGGKYSHCTVWVCLSCAVLPWLHPSSGHQEVLQHNPKAKQLGSKGEGKAQWLSKGKATKGNQKKKT